MDDVVFKIETSSNLRQWNEDAVILSSTTNEGMQEIIWRDTVPIQDATSRFMRLRILSSE